MNIEKEDIITLEDNREYEVVEKVNLNNETYLLLLSKEEKLSVVKVGIENGKTFFDKLTDKEYEEVILKLTEMKI